MSRVLVIEDERHIARLVSSNLATVGHQVLVAHTGEEGLRLAAAHRPDLVMLDLKMPGMSGWEVLRTFRSSKELHDVPVILMTAFPGAGSRQEIIDRGVQDILNKPFGVDDLLQTVEKTLGRRGVRNATSKDSDRR